jgi:hypothetical protein
MLQNVLVEPICLLLNMLSRTFSYTKTSSKVSTDCTDKIKGYILECQNYGMNVGFLFKILGMG